MRDESVLAHISKLKKFDLNLLVIFELIFVTGSVKQAAETLSVTSPAISQALVKLRNFFGDPLFVRQGQNLSPTTIAVSLHAHLGETFGPLLNSITHLSEPQIKSRFVVYCSPYAAIRILPFVAKQIELHNFNCEILHISSDAVINNIDDILTYRKADFILDTNSYYSFSTVSEPFIFEDTVAVCRKGHPRLGKTLTKEQLQSERSTRLLVDSEVVRRTQTGLDDNLGDRDFFFSSSSIISLAAMVEYSDCVSFVSGWFAQKFCDTFDFRILETNFVPEKVCFYLTYNKSSLKNKDFTFLLSCFNACAQELSTSESGEVDVRYRPD